LQTESNNVEETYSIFDLKGGDALISGEYTSTNESINLTGLSSGTYILKIARWTY